MAEVWMLSRAQMKRLEPHFPLSHGVARVDDRRVISGIIYVIKHGLQWKDAPSGYGPHKTLYNRFAGPCVGCAQHRSAYVFDPAPTISPPHYDINTSDPGPLQIWATYNPPVKYAPASTSSDLSDRMNEITNHAGMIGCGVQTNFEKMRLMRNSPRSSQFWICKSPIFDDDAAQAFAIKVMDVTFSR